MDALDAGLRDVHPDHSRRILDRMAELEQTCRSHVNMVLKVVDNQRQALQTMVTRAERRGDVICLAVELDHHCCSQRSLCNQ